MTTASVAIDPVFKALADPTRRAVLDRLSRGAAAVSELARPFDMALPSFLQHLKLLEGAGLVRSRKHGRVRTYELQPEQLHMAEDWLLGRIRSWERRLDQLDQYVTTLKENENE